MIKSKRFLEEWLEYGEQRDKEPYSFISYYIAFNFLYNRYPRERRKTDGSMSTSEFNQILNFIDDRERYRIDKEINFISLFDKLDFDSEYYKSDIWSEKNSNKASAQKIRQKDVYELFYAIYIVRCNLFHGSKSLLNEDDRNKNLLIDGSKVLKELIRICLEL